MEKKRPIWWPPAPTTDANIVFGTTTETGTNTITTDPLFTDAGGGDFTTKPDSPANNAAAYTGYTTMLWWGTTWPDNVRTMGGILDIGAYPKKRGSAGQ